MKLHIAKVCITFRLMMMVKGSSSGTENSGSEEVAETANDSTKYYIVRGWEGGVCADTDHTSCEMTAVDMNEKHKVRCCSDNTIDGWTHFPEPECDVWANSNVPECFTETYADAEEKCRSAGGRLCNRAELVSGCTRGTGCNFNDHMVWSSTPLTLSPTRSPTSAPTPIPSMYPTHNQYYIVHGWEGGECRNTDYTTCKTTAADMEESHAVRCCSTEKPENGDTWIKRPGCEVWAESDVPECYRTSYTMAEQICADFDARLCKREELEGGCTAGTGCNFNHYMVWSSTSTAHYYIVHGWKGGECRNTDYTTCEATAVNMEESHAVRCCSDKELTGWIKRPECEVWAASPGCYRASHTRAEQHCAGVHARLCTKEELKSGCTAGTGCNFNHYMVWSSTEGKQS